MEELNSGPPKTNPCNGREEDLNIDEDFDAGLGLTLKLLRQLCLMWKLKLKWYI